MMDAVAKGNWTEVDTLPGGNRRSYSMARFYNGNNKEMVLAANGILEVDTYYTAFVAMYDVEDDSWEEMGDFPVQLYSAGVFVHENTVW